MPQGNCLLCGREADLQESHVIPAFIFRWLRKSGSGYLRFAENPNRRIQDGFKRYWLCPKCEQRFSRSESAFAQKLFHPYTQNPGKRVRYSRWLNYFCTSVTWRILHFYLQEGHLGDWNADAVSHVLEAEQRWRKVLLGEAPHARECQQHLLPFDQIEHASTTLPPNINRYLMRAIDMDICRGEDSILIYAKVARFVIVGFVHETNARAWKGTKVHANEGLIEPKKHVLPAPFFNYMIGKAGRMADAINSISLRQSEKIDEDFRKNVDFYVGSDEFQAVIADISMFGKAALHDSEDGAE